MKLSDILVLAKQGYSASDIKELIQLAEGKEVEKLEPDTETKETETETTSDKGTEETEQTEAHPDETDYKSLYEQTAAELKKLQADNRRDTSGSTPKTPEQIAIEHFNRYLK